jgi:hypothetical protein
LGGRNCRKREIRIISIWEKKNCIMGALELGAGELHERRHHEEEEHENEEDSTAVKKDPAREEEQEEEEGYASH